MLKYVSIFICLISGCTGEQDKSVIYLPYFDSCEEAGKALNKDLNDRNTNPVFKIISPNLLLTSSKPLTKYLQIEVLASDVSKLEPIFNDYMFKCGPNSSIELDISSLGENEIRSIIGRYTHEKEYSKELLYSLDGKTLTVYFTKDM